MDGVYGFTTGDFRLSNGALFNNSTSSLLTITEATVDIDGASTATSYTADAGITGVLVTTTGLNQPGIAVTNAGTYQVLAANTGRVHIIGDFGQVCTITLPAAAAGLNYEFWYYGSAAETHDDTLKTTSNSFPFKGGVAFMDVANAISAVYPNGSTNSSMALNNMAGGTCFKVFTDGTSWFLTGTIVSDTAPTFADQ